jgi:hypothetical protein
MNKQGWSPPGTLTQLVILTFDEVLTGSNYAGSPSAHDDANTIHSTVCHPLRE